MSGLATFMKYLGYNVSGSDITSSDITATLKNKGINVFIGHNEKNIGNDTELVVYSGAINLFNPELVVAKKNDIVTMERSEFLGQICELFNNVIAVAGTHGKTTTTALIGEMLTNAGLNPTIHVGGEVNAGYHNFRVGGTVFFVTEACEYKKSLEYINSKVAIITNIEKDHMDCYSGLQDIYKSFNKFAQNAASTLIVYDHKNVIKNIAHKNVITCGDSNNNYTFFNLKKDTQNKYSFEVKENEHYMGEFTLNIAGKYNVYNAILAIACVRQFGVSYEVIYKTLKNFGGIKRRNEFLGTYKGTKVFADYAHHPTEIKESLANYKEVYKKVLCIYQPHTYSRTQTLLKQFSTCFKDADKVMLFKTYPARESYIIGGDATDMYQAVKKSDTKKFYVADYAGLKKLVFEHYKNAGVILVLGAGDLYDHIKEVLDIKPVS